MRLWWSKEGNFLSLSCVLWNSGFFLIRRMHVNIAYIPKIISLIYSFVDLLIPLWFNKCFGRKLVTSPLSIPTFTLLTWPWFSGVPSSEFNICFPHFFAGSNSQRIHSSQWNTDGNVVGGGGSDTFSPNLDGTGCPELQQPCCQHEVSSMRGQGRHCWVTNQCSSC